MSDAPTMFPEVREAAAPASKDRWQYARKPATTQGGDEGWIVQVPVAPNLKADYEGRGFKYLTQYGTFTNGTRNGDPKEGDMNGAAWNPADEPFRLIFQKGGQHEFPVSQIVAYNWHIQPPYAEADFPQLADHEVTSYQCPECEQPRYISALNKQQAAVNLRHHLTSQSNTRHAYKPTDLLSLGEQYGIDFSIGRIGNINPVVNVGKPKAKREAAPAA